MLEAEISNPQKRTALAVLWFAEVITLLIRRILQYWGRGMASDQLLELYVTRSGGLPQAILWSTVLANFVLDLMVTNFTSAVDPSNVRPYAKGLQPCTNYLS